MQSEPYCDVFDASGERLAAGTRVERVRASEEGTDTSRYPSDIWDDDRPENNDSEDTAEKHTGYREFGSRRRGKKTRDGTEQRNFSATPRSHRTTIHKGCTRAWSVGTASASVLYVDSLTSMSTTDIAMLIPQDLSSDAATASS